jgi:hypothetical protein
MSLKLSDEIRYHLKMICTYDDPSRSPGKGVKEGDHMQRLGVLQGFEIIKYPSFVEVRKAQGERTTSMQYLRGFESVLGNSAAASRFGQRRQARD